MSKEDGTMTVTADTLARTYPALQLFNHNSPVIPGPVSGMETEVRAIVIRRIRDMDEQRFNAEVNLALTSLLSQPYERRLLMHTVLKWKRIGLVLFLTRRDWITLKAEVQARIDAEAHAAALTQAITASTDEARATEDTHRAARPKAVTVIDHIEPEAARPTGPSREDVEKCRVEAWSGLTKTMKGRLKTERRELYLRVSRPLPTGATPAQVRQMDKGTKALLRWATAYKQNAAKARGRSTQARQRPAGTNAGNHSNRNRTPRAARQPADTKAAAPASTKEPMRAGKTAKDRERRKGGTLANQPKEEKAA